MMRIRRLLQALATVKLNADRLGMKECIGGEIMNMKEEGRQKEHSRGADEQGNNSEDDQRIRLWRPVRAQQETEAPEARGALIEGTDEEKCEEKKDVANE
jgi:hypothetical protein